MTTRLGKKLFIQFTLRVRFVNVIKFCVCHSFPFGILGGMWDMIVLIPDHCLSIYFNFPILCNNNIPSSYATEFMPLNGSDMLETVANVKTLLIEGSCSPIYCCHRVIAERSLCQH